MPIYLQIMPLRSVNYPLRLLVDNEMFVWANPTKKSKQRTGHVGMSVVEVWTIQTCFCINY